MPTMKGEDKLRFHDILAASGRSAEIPEPDDAYGWLIGSWELDVYDFQTDGAVRQSKGEAYFSWILEGRAVQDVWIMPRRSERTAGMTKICNRYGTTLRVWDASIQAWRVTWINPVTGRCDNLIGRWSGDDVVQVGTHSDGTPIRWVFTDVALDSFRWLGETLQQDGKTWKLETEFHAKRMRSCLP